MSGPRLTVSTLAQPWPVNCQTAERFQTSHRLGQRGRITWSSMVSGLEGCRVEQLGPRCFGDDGMEDSVRLSRGKEFPQKTPRTSPPLPFFSVTTNLSGDRKCPFMRQSFRSSRQIHRQRLPNDRPWVRSTTWTWNGPRFPKQTTSRLENDLVQSCSGLLSQIPTNQANQHLAMPPLTSHTPPPPLRPPSPTAPRPPSTAPADPPTAASPCPHGSPSTPPPPPP